ncbi:MAG: hypothetical protein SO016_09305 [Lachnospiraceae bacterium]|nr:hypothetical protein [Robinsoniella sp.]MDY3766867.1 hypothetical protein [Lachnospiraceae bacterium]
MIITVEIYEQIRKIRLDGFAPMLGSKEKECDNHRLIYSTKINYESVVVDFGYCYNSGRGVRQFGAKYITGGNPVW